VHLYLIRHAESVNNAGWNDPNYTHVEDAPLSEIGQEQAVHLANTLRQHVDDEDLQTAFNNNLNLPVYPRFDELHSSPFRRALQTARPLANALDMPVHVMMDIYEHGGIFRREGDTVVTFPGLSRDEMRAIVNHAVIPEAVTDNGWWTMDVYEPEDEYIARGARVASFLKEQAREAWRGKHIAMITHAAFTNLLLQTLFRGGINSTPRDYGFLYSYNAGVTRLDFADEGYPVLRYFSRVDHLPLVMVTR
jgi:2,3-bisphosphoglycerate-dependent phosphoglycerate mutase